MPTQAEIEALLRRMKSNTSPAPALGTGMTGLSYSGPGGMPGSGGGSGLNPNYSPNITKDIALGSMPSYSNMDDASFDRQYQNQFDTLQRTLADATSEYGLANQRDDEEYQRATRETGQQQELDASALIDKLANQGILRSGIQVKASSDLANSYQRRLAEFERMRNQGRSDRERGFSTLQRSVQDQTNTLQEERTTREAAKQEAIARRMAEALQSQQPVVGANGQVLGWSANYQGNPALIGERADAVSRNQASQPGYGQGASDANAVWGQDEQLEQSAESTALYGPTGPPPGTQPPPYAPSAPAPSGPSQEFIQFFQSQPPEVQAYLLAAGRK